MFGLKKKEYLEWYSDDIRVTEENINEMLELSRPKSSCWWSNLKSTINSEFGSYSEYIKHQHHNGNTDLMNTHATVKQCPAVTNILTNSYLIKSPSDITITLTKDYRFLYNTANNLIDVDSHHIEQFSTEKSNIFEGKINLKFMIPINIKTNNTPWIFTQPLYHNNMWFDVTPGSIFGNYTKGQPLFINVLVDIPKDEPITYEIKAGDVLAYMWFPKRIELKHSKTKFMLPLFNRNWSSKSRFM
jgi:hypothetical protein